MTSAAEQTFARELPHNLDAERSVLGSCLQDSEAIGGAFEVFGAHASPDIFYASSHQQIWSAMRAIDMRSEPIDAVTLPNELKQQGVFDEVGGLRYIAELSGAVPASANVEYYAGIVREAYQLRSLIALSAKIRNSAYDHVSSPDIMSEIDTAIHKLNTATRSRGALQIGPLASSILESAERTAAGNPDPIPGIQTGLPMLDSRIINGLEPGNFVVIAARPSTGKTALACLIAGKSATRHQSKVLIFSLEMSSEQIAERIAFSLHGADSKRVKTGFQNLPELVKLKRADDELKEAPIFVDDEPVRNMSSIRSAAIRFQAQNGLDVVIIDFMQLVRGEGRSTKESKAVEVEEISRRCKSLARELEVPVIVLSQLSRQNEAENRPPRLSDLRWSGGIEQDADIAILLHTAEQPDTRGVAKLNINIAKYRNGPVTKFDTFYDRPRQTIHEIDPSYDEPETPTTFDQQSNAVADNPTQYEEEPDDPEDDVPF